MAHNSSEPKVRSSCFRLAIKCKLPWRERDAGNVGFTSGLPTLQQEVGERNRVLIRTFRCVGVSRNKQHSTTEQPGSGFISISCHFSAAKFINGISRASLPHCAILLRDLPCDGLGNVHCAPSFTACWKQELKLQSLRLQAFNHILGRPVSHMPGRLDELY